MLHKEEAMQNNKSRHGRRHYDRALSMATRADKPSAKVFKLLEEGDRSGDMRATYALATWYLFGTPFTKRNLAKAVQMLRQAASANVAEAAFDLGVAYERGVGVKKSLKQAFSFYVQAALLGDAQAHYAIGRMCYYGLRAARNRQIAEHWLSKAEELGIKT